MSGMKDTALGLILNFFDDIELYGHVPNGGRIYYISRSQPPLLSCMVMDLLPHLDPAAQQSFKARALVALEREYAFWMSERAVHVQGHVLNRYWCDAEGATPRPESYREDVATAAGDTTVYAELRAAAESGWDFSSRWWPDTDNNSSSPSNTETSGSDTETRSKLRHTRIRTIVPVDLNTMMFNLETHLAELCAACGRSTDAQKYRSSADARARAMQALMWDAECHLWRDLMLTSSTETATPSNSGAGLPVYTCKQSPCVSAACFIPLWGGAELCKDVATEKVMSALQTSGLLGPGGCMCTLNDSGEQWDRNVWPPIQWFIVEGEMRFTYTL